MTSNSACCPVCSSSKIERFFEMNSVPVICNVLHASVESAVNALRGNIHLGFCISCGHIFNYAFDASLIHYTQEYENSLHFSPRFQQYADQLAHDLIERHNLHNKTIIEIGCGKGDFLKLMCEAGNNRGVGFDSSFQSELTETNDRFTVVRDFYSQKYRYINTDFLICRHVLEHIASPRKFIADIFDTQLPVAHSYFEVPNALWTLRDLGIWDLIYEHCSYFTPESLSMLFTSSGFEVLQLEQKFDGQFLGIESKAATHAPQLHADTTAVTRLVYAFAENFHQKVDHWTHLFNEWKDRRVVVWGGGSKGVTFLNVLKPAVEYVVDLNRRKQGMYVAGTAQKIVPPEFLQSYQPDIVIIMNPIYETEIRSMLYPKAEIVVA